MRFKEFLLNEAPPAPGGIGAPGVLPPGGPPGMGGPPGLGGPPGIGASPMGGPPGLGGPPGMGGPPMGGDPSQQQSQQKALQIKPADVWDTLEGLLGIDSKTPAKQDQPQQQSPQHLAS